jgi:hypothetical protein
MLKWILKILFAIGFILCIIVVGIMYNKLSFIDWPYVVGAIVLLVAAILIPVKNQTN